MSIWENVTKTSTPNAHGEVTLIRIDEGELPAEGWSEFTDISQSGNFILGHSEQGHHHVLDREGVTVHQRESEGFRVLRLIVEKPINLWQEANNPHEKQIVHPGTYISTQQIERPFFQAQARRVAD